ncbi:hypothetical protein DFJ73DRAFT_823516 [Zopfochytrium polystomum]|nr:hypothetical protein DFJ73DRAFT_823516 [Zopfochytrium polystomum]
MAPAAAAAAAAAAEGDDAILRNRAPSATAAAAGLARDDSGVNLAAAAADEKPPRGDVPDGDEDEDVLPDPEEEEERKKMIASFHTSIVSAKTGWQSVTPFRQVIFLYKLFFSRQFFVHRVVGLVFLLQYAAAFYLYFADYATFKASVLVFTLPGTGVFQTVTAIYTFTFLPKKAKDGGYFGDKSIMSYPFIIENSFFALILYYAYLYFDDRGRSLLQSTVLVEQVFVFFPYILRTLWPKTSFRDSYENQRNRTSKRDMFFRAAIMITKSFYVWAKHYIGYFLNYARFLDRVNNEEVRFIQQVLIFSSFSTTISIFLQTLKVCFYSDRQRVEIFIRLAHR